jgi:hypothetical protein
MTRFRIVAVTAAVVIALAAWWVPFEEGGGAACSGGGTCAEEPPASGGSGSPDWFYGGEGMDRIRGGDDDRPDAREGPRGEDEFRCGPGRDEAPTGAGEELPRSCEDVRARFF